MFHQMLMVYVQSQILWHSHCCTIAYYIVIFIVAVVITYTLIDSSTKRQFCSCTALVAFMMYKLEPDQYDYHVCHNYKYGYYELLLT